MQLTVYMFYKLIVLLTAFLIFSCQSPDDCSERLYNCWLKSYNEFGVDLRNEISNLEKKLIERGYLRDSTYYSYIDFLCNYADSNINIGNLDDFKFGINKSLDNNTQCDEVCKKTALEFSSFASEYFKISNTGMDRNELRNCLSEQKFNNSPIYKTWILLNLYLKFQAKNQFSKVLKEIAKPKDKPGIRDTLTFFDGKYRWNGQRCSLKSLRARTNGKKAVVFIADEKITFGEFTSLLDTMRNLGVEVVIK